MTQNDQDDFICPHCGAPVASDASFCRECGASDDSGWEEEDFWSGEGAEDDFDYDEFLRREFPDHASPSANQRLREAFILIVVLLVCLALALAVIF